MVLVSKREVVVLALEDAGGSTSAIDTEDVAKSAFALAPASFSWRKYDDQIDLDSVRVSLTDAAKPKYGAHVAGSVKAGWHITPAGLAWLTEAGARVRDHLTESQPSGRASARLATHHSASEAARVRGSRAFAAWEDGKELPPSRLIAAAFRVDQYTTARDRNLKLNRIVRIAEELEDRVLLEFVSEVTPLVLELGVDSGDEGGTQ